ncbi:hypothetical protein [Natrinema salifodinae]|uniref:Uncharacterized protein n=1 Tax=Natrinema salifodinae TaxID=1202768 RepID=A0A1I0QGN5_9EURY|nr:hypothetical protein [Natrinema salifodinae]SEW26222.1 hypothetical protein SAMN05216285_3554 [Natrinema salifodinae]
MRTDTDADTAADGRLPIDARDPAASTLGRLDHPLLGREPRRTVLAVAYLVGLVAMFCASYLGARLTIDGVVLDAASTSGFDALSMVFIAFVSLTLLVVAPCYALWNGGPALSFALPLVPVAMGDVLSGAYVLDLDVAIALTVGAGAAAIALAADDARRARSLRDWRVGIDEDRLLFVTASAIVAGVGVGRFLAAAPAYIREWYAPAGACWLLTGAVVGGYWLAWIGTVWRTRVDQSTAETESTS